MSTVNFEDIKTKFINADLDEKIRIYTTTEGLSVEQFRELLRYYPIQHLSKLEKAFFIELIRYIALFSVKFPYFLLISKI